MTTPIPVFVRAEDPLTAVGLEAALKSRPEVTLVGKDDITACTVAVAAVEAFSDATVRALRAVSSRGCSRMVLVTDGLAEERLLEVAAMGVCAVLPRAEATACRLVQLIVGATAGQGSLPAALPGRLLAHAGRVQRKAPSAVREQPTGLSEREMRVLQLVSEGYDTREIARRLSYSERTVKSALHDITSRYRLKNRSQAVAYALREGLI
ncbi:helix-turn-helix transcriptional regulator [Streptomyces chartreusis]|uniref:helix-turn-helix transcriptional regulator n=1 Tax=Streptomyces chartreusis TaxID=1969 RepID=UPI002E7FE6FA|nr:LuxR C-terminal-related transcriptional regulator [Streptomyces chartreusis]WUB16279.1 LuxR C-terminal-related transcriptional regulator [Streptomyces chartreusis]